jgi:hypothetical protein
MKRGLILLATVVFFLLLLGAVLYAVLRQAPAPSPNATTSFPAGTLVGTGASTEASPATFTSGFYSWYLSHYVADPAFDISKEFATNAPTWLTADFIGRYADTASTTGMNPILLAQDYAPSWPSSIAVRIVSQTDAAADVTVSLGTGMELHALAVHLVHVTSGWRIASVTPAP